ncbi:MAG: hypothetical protein FWC41_04175 [Firmicutes bacterium]|nr:hypothetical protein [Bacillota bacterium]
MDTNVKKIGFVKKHIFDNQQENNYVYNVTLFDKEIEALLPNEGKLRLYAIDTEGADKLSVVAVRDAGDVYKTKFVLDIDPVHFDKKNENYKLDVDNGYINLIASKMKDKESFSVYQKQIVDGNRFNKYVGFGSEQTHGVIIGKAYSDKTAKGYDYQNIVVSTQKLDTERHSFINVYQPADTEKSKIAFGYHKPMKNAETIIQLSKKGKDFINNLPDDMEFRITVQDRNPQNINPMVNFANLNVFVYDKENNVKNYIGSGWSNEQFNSLPLDVSESIYKNEAPKLSFNFEVGQYIAYTFDKDYTLNFAVKSGVIDNPVAIGEIVKISDSKLTLTSAMGQTSVDRSLLKSDNSFAFCDKIDFEVFNDFYKNVQNESMDLALTADVGKKNNNSVKKEKTEKVEKTEKKEKKVVKNKKNKGLSLGAP